MQKVDLKRRQLALWAAGTPLLGLAGCGGGGGGGGGGAGGGVADALPPDATTTEQWLTVDGRPVALHFQDAAQDNLAGCLQVQTLGSRLVPTTLTVDAGTGSAQVAFDADGEITTLTDLLGGGVTHVSRVGDRYEYRSHDADGAFVSGVVVWPDAGRVWMAQFATETYVLATLTATDITHALNDVRTQLGLQQGAAVASWSRRLFQLMPLGAAHAQSSGELTWGDAAAVVVSAGKTILAVGWGAVVGVAVGSLFGLPAIAVAGLGLVGLLAGMTRANAAVPQELLQAVFDGTYRSVTTGGGYTHTETITVEAERVTGSRVFTDGESSDAFNWTARIVKVAAADGMAVAYLQGTGRRASSGDPFSLRNARVEVHDSGAARVIWTGWAPSGSSGFGGVSSRS